MYKQKMYSFDVYIIVIYSNGVFTIALYTWFKREGIFWFLFLIPKNKCCTNIRKLVSALRYWILKAKYGAISPYKALTRSNIFENTMHSTIRKTWIVPMLYYIFNFLQTISKPNKTRFLINSHFLISCIIGKFH